MKFQCELCKELSELVDFSTSEEGITVRCAECGGDFFLSAPQEEGPADAEVEETGGGASEDEDSTVAERDGAEEPADGEESEKGEEQGDCPKCGAARQLPEQDACFKCGLEFANVGVTFHPEEHLRGEADQKASELWAAVERSWDDPERHDAFLNYCTAAGLLEHAGTRYHRRISEHGEDEIGRERMGQIVARVQALMLDGVSVVAEKRNRWVKTVRFALIVVTVILICGLLYLLLARWGTTDYSPLPGL